MEETEISGYWYDFGGGKRAIGLGYSSLYNHSSRPNAVYVLREDPDVIVIVALREIKPGTEIKVNYNGEPKNKAKLYFELPAKAEDHFTHYTYYGGEWVKEGWSWCGEQPSLRTNIPSLVTCSGCIDIMVEARDGLANWGPSLRPRRVTKHGVLATLDWLVQELEDYDSADGVAIAEDIRKALKRIPAKDFPGYKNGKAK